VTSQTSAEVSENTGEGRHCPRCPCSAPAAKARGRPADPAHLHSQNLRPDRALLRATSASPAAAWPDAFRRAPCGSLPRGQSRQCPG